MARHSSFYSMKHTCFCADSSQIFSLSEEESTNKEYGFLGHSDYTKRPVFLLSVHRMYGAFYMKLLLDTVQKKDL